MSADADINEEYILIVDDTPENLDILRDLLKGKYRLKAALNGEGCLKIAKSEKKPSLILLDIMMPGMDGFEVCRELQSSEDTADIPVIFLTAMSRESDIVKGFAAGAVDYVRKPFNPAELLSRVDTHLKVKRHEDFIRSVSEERKELLHMLCHDLTNPMGFVISIARLSEENPEEIKRFIGDIKTVMENGLDTVDLVRKMMALDENKIHLSIEKMNLNDLLQESLRILNRRIEEKEIRMELDVDPEFQVRVEKTSFVNSVVNNLLTNAMKFSEPGSVIQIQAERVNGHLDLSIRDHGIGMPESVLQNIFDAGKSVSRSGTRGERGTGYGMPLVKKFIEAYGGSITIDSKEKETDPDGHGTEVRMKLNVSSSE
ncbi:MAG: hybrid sensor histidine kinase/response regulator [Spirochaetia bacterium]|nr:hybrid sensor histidine kinase/response regulator [Spirochaetia bacterium]